MNLVLFFQNAKNDTIAEWKARIAEKTQKLVWGGGRGCYTQLKMFRSEQK